MLRSAVPLPGTPFLWIGISATLLILGLSACTANPPPTSRTVESTAKPSIPRPEPPPLPPAPEPEPEPPQTAAPPALATTDPPAPVVDPEENLAAAARGGEPGLCTRYIETYPGGRHTSEMVALCDALEWRRVINSGRIAELRAWLADNPDDPRSKEARRQWEELRYAEVEASDSPTACDLYLGEFPEGARAAEVRQRGDELRAWEAVQRRDSVAGYRAYLGSGDEKPGRRVARERATQRYWLGRAERDPNDAHALVQLAEACLLERACTLDQMESLYRRALEIRLDDPRALLGLARIAYNRDDFDTAEALVDSSLLSNGGSSEAHLYRGRLLARRGDYSSAIAELDRALELDDQNLEAHFHRGIYRLRNADCRAGTADFEKVLALARDRDSKYLREAQRHLRDCR